LRLAVLGDPVEHSLSPVIQRAAMAACGIEGSYEARRVDVDGVRLVMEEIRAGSLDGANVTMPHKELVARLCDWVEPAAARAGSVNTLVGRNGEVAGYSTDIGGILDSWGPLSNSAPILVLGAGGAAASALIALGKRTLYAAARRAGAVTALAGRTGAEVGEVRWGVPVVGAVVVNTTPLGMNGEKLPDLVLEWAGGLFDMPYGSRPTPSSIRMAAAERPVVEGLQLLVAQGARSFQHWTGLTPSRQIMRAAAENHLRAMPAPPNLVWEAGRKEK
jgi:shikimate dehydrogenase